MKKKAIVFGGSGFVGSHVADSLSEAGFDIVIYDVKPSPYLKNSQKMVVGDVMDERAVRAAVRGCDYVYNFAGVSDMSEACQKPLESVRINIYGNSVILEACRMADVERYVFASSLYVYSKDGTFYRSTKQACELIIENYHEVFDLNYTIIRYGSLYGERADERNFIHQVLTQALKDGKITREGDGEELREYIHVRDAAKNSVEILSDEFANRCVMISGAQQIKIKDLFVMIREMLGNNIEIEYKPPTRESYHYEITPYAFAPKLATKLLNKNYIDLGQGILASIHSIYSQLNPAQAESGVLAGNEKGR